MKFYTRPTPGSKKMEAQFAAHERSRRLVKWWAIGALLSIALAVAAWKGWL